MRTAADVMTAHPVSADPGASLADCAEQMRRHHIRHLLIPWADGQICVLSQEVAIRGGSATAGEVAPPAPTVPRDLPLESLLLELLGSDGDLLAVVDDKNVPIGVFTLHDAMRIASSTLLDDVPVEKLAATQPVCAEPDWSLQQARSAMQQHGIRHLPVIYEGRLVGIVSRRDLEERAPEAESFLAEIASPPTETIVGDTTVREAAERMALQKVGCLPVMGPDNALHALLTATDVLRALIAEIRRVS